MKTKIFTLIIAILCLSMIFVACDNKQPCTEHKDENNDLVCDVCAEGLEPETDATTGVTTEATTEPPVEPCETHTDANSDKVCDVCKYALVYIPELVAPNEETHADMEVSPIPGDATLSDFVNVDFKDDGFFTSAQKMEGYVVDQRYIYNFNMSVEKVAISDEEGSVLRYIVRNVETLEVIVSVSTSDWYQTSVTLYDSYIEISRVGELDASFENYTYSGQRIGNPYSWTFNEEGESVENFYYDNVRLSYLDSSSSILYLIDKADMVYAIDIETKSIIHTENVDLLIKRPDFDAVEGNYGYVYNSNAETLYIYDLNEWIKCVMSYEMPGYYYYDDWFVLQNGNVLIQGIVTLSDDAVNFDVLESGSKYDLVYTVIDVQSQQINNVEFGYYIMSAHSLNESEVYTEKAENMFYVCPINNDRLDMNRRMYLLVNNDLTISCDVTDFSKNYGSLIADGLFLGSLSYENSSVYLDKIVDLNGKEITLPTTADIRGNYIIYKNGIYNFEMQLLMEPLKDNVYSYVEYKETYVLLVKEIVDEYYNVRYEYFYYDPSDTIGPVKLASNATIVNYTDAFFVVRYEYTVFDEYGERIEYKYEIVNSKNQVLLTTDSNVWNWNIYDSYASIELYNGDKYVLK